MKESVHFELSNTRENFSIVFELRTLRSIIILHNIDCEGVNFFDLSK